MNRRIALVCATAIALIVGVTATPLAAYADTSQVVSSATTVESQDCHDASHVNFGTYTTRYMFDGDVITVNYTNCNSNFSYGYASPYPAYAWNYGNLYVNVGRTNSPAPNTAGVRAPAGGANYSVPGYDRQCIKVSSSDPGSWTGVTLGVPQMTATMTSAVIAPVGNFVYDQGSVCGGTPGWNNKQIVYVIVPVQPQVTTAFASPRALTNAPVSLVITLSNTQVFRSGTYGAFTGVGFTMALPAGATATGGSTTCRGGSVTTPAGNTQIQLAGGSLGGAGNATEASCTVTVPVTFTTEGAKALTSASLTAGATNRGSIYDNTDYFNKVAASVTVSSTAISPDQQTVTGYVGMPITPTAAYTPTGLTAPITYSVSPGLPGGLRLDTATGVISGTPTGQQVATTYTITASDGTKTATAGVTVTVTVSPPAISPASQDVSGQAGKAITPTTPFTPAGLTAPITYSVSPDLPAGLTLNTSTGVISGTPTAEQSSLTYTIRASGGGFTADSTVNIAIAAGGGSGGGTGGDSGLPDTGTSLKIVGITLGSALVLYLAGLFIFRGRRQLGFIAVNSKVSARMAELDAMLTRMEDNARRRRIRRR